MMYLFKYVSILLKARLEKLIPPQNSQATAFMTDAYEANSEVRLLSILYQTSQLTPLGLPNKYLTRSRQRQNQNRKASHLTFHLHALSFTLTTTEHPLATTTIIFSSTFLTKHHHNIAQLIIITDTH